MTCMAKQNAKTEKESERTSLRDQLLGRIERDDLGQQNREISVMTRMSTDIVEILDALVELEIFKSRSEAVSAFVEQTIYSRKSLFEEIRDQARDITKKRESAKHLAFEAIRSKQG